LREQSKIQNPKSKMPQTDSNPPSLHHLNPLDRFADRVDNYVKYRPSYSDAAIDLILDGLRQNPLVADIGAGTGISARLLANRGARVLAIEPNTAMRTVAQSHPLVEFRDGKAEATGLESTTVDLVTCFTAFHWFEPEPTLQEFRRILKSTSGRLALVWNNRDLSDPFTNEYSEVTEAASTYPVVHDRSSYAQPLIVSPHFTKVREYTVANHQGLDCAGLVGRARSNSYIPNEGAALQELTSNLEKLHDRFQDDRGLVYLSYLTSIHIAEPSTEVGIAE
jgi:SAM-dependent methyltransferase